MAPVHCFLANRAYSWTGTLILGCLESFVMNSTTITILTIGLLVSCMWLMPADARSHRKHPDHRGKHPEAHGYDNGSSGKGNGKAESGMSGPKDKDEVKEYSNVKNKQHTATRGRDDPDSRYGES
ncbi:uncharacterized protein LOC129589532 [Paramacrobiotus metropolitanus]|uniref:uncharacterized protein LOC129589532 n=1 Tax=Paramacrobiotus metropolitanus TaxID=2943436 RepID=UPI002446195B|nr:uncharacterized protein LOC129589532 [Paramacrobiotus metropolitanus]